MKSFQQEETLYKSEDLHKWRLKVEDGRQTWHYLQSIEEEKNWPQTECDKYWLGILKDDTSLKKNDCLTAKECARIGFKFFSKLQTDDGHWAGEYGGPMFLLPGYVIAMYVTNSPYPAGYQKEIIRYLKNRANREDGGFGIHIEGVSTVFGTALNYVALRLLGTDAEDPVCQKARATLYRLGGAVGIPSWGKFWLAILNCYEWEGMNPVPTEPWLLPYITPIHPAKMWIHTRQVYLPMGYLYCAKFKAKENKLIQQLRSELYVEDYFDIYWPSQKNNCAKVDLYSPHTVLHDFCFAALSIYEQLPNSWIRERAQKVALEHIRQEDLNTDYACLGPVNKVMNMLVSWLVDGPESVAFKKHLERNNDFLWMANDGMRMNGTNGSQLWDTAFTCQALVESGLSNEKEFEKNVLKALQFLNITQIQENMKDHEKYYRHISKGAWPFSTKTQSYTVSDCTAEGLKAVIMLQNLSYTPKLISEKRMEDAVNVLLSMQNADGGFASYELIRGYQWLEWLNPAEVFDGSWFGSWAICYTYACFFGVESLASAGEFYSNSDSVKRACDFIVSKQMNDGGWGEKYKACELGEWVNHEKSQVVNTAWAVLALMAAKYPNKDIIRRGVQVFA
ncbi:Lanosterol synthase (Oxidosqualene--lanosterol cyclase) [Clydaea vesicula]|uniref:Terpene cyclase/mutase family member n=1 Tax=Clydaea vesicula TaxID=447962 RepID=A0AAD5U961_9FUNG|nr:Lanosterol synthase (Oxidosqualene--lanosterol cyclase) [Clydaea vesicula]